MFSTILSAELVSGEPSDEDSAWIETGGDSLTFSESHLMGAELPATGTCHIRTTGDRLGLFFWIDRASERGRLSACRCRLCRVWSARRLARPGPTRGVLPSLRGSWLDTLGILL